VVPIYGLNYKDRREDAHRVARELGRILTRQAAVDFDGRVGIDYGVTEHRKRTSSTKGGMIRSSTLPDDARRLERKDLPVVQELNRQGAAK
jgi:cytochrome c biogenesis protein CcmG/thiol:disulfide interchange protein DsbE